jgi:hypothetical protein
MTERTSQTIVHFDHAFSLPGFDTPQGAGDYRVDHDEEAIEAYSRIMWMRVRSYIHLPGIGVTSASRQMVPITPADLESALEKDRNHEQP